MDELLQDLPLVVQCDGGFAEVQVVDRVSDRVVVGTQLPSRPHGVDEIHGLFQDW